MEYCANCGSLREANEKYCGKCGFNMEEKPKEYKYDRNFNRINESSNGNIDMKLSKKTSKISPLKILAWIFLFPVMLVYTFFTSSRINKWFKIYVLLNFIVINVSMETDFFSPDSAIPGLLLILIFIGSIVGYILDRKKRKMNIALEEKRKYEQMLIEQKETERVRNEQAKEADITNRAIEFVFSSEGFKDKVDSFILQHTKRYDFGEINSEVYYKSLKLLKEYIEKNTDFGECIPKNELNDDIIDFVSANSTLILPLSSIENVVNERKMKIYAEEMGRRLNITSDLPIEDIAKQYLSIYGDKGLKVLNLSILNNVLDEDVDSITRIVKSEHQKKLNEYEKKRIETQLFNTTNNLRNIEYIDKLNGFEFEDFLKELFVSYGYNTEDLPYSNDYGADLIINKGFNRIVIQAKNYSGSVGNKAVQEVVAAKSHYKCDTAMVISNSYFTPNAIKTAESSEVILIDRDNLIKILNGGEMYFNSLVS